MPAKPASAPALALRLAQRTRRFLGRFAACERLIQRLRARFPGLRFKAPPLLPPPRVDAAAMAAHAVAHDTPSTYDILALGAPDRQADALLAGLAAPGRRVFAVCLDAGPPEGTVVQAGPNLWRVCLPSPRDRAPAGASPPDDFTAVFENLRTRHLLVEAACVALSPDWAPLAAELSARLGWPAVTLPQDRLCPATVQASLDAAVRQALPLASIVIVTYNNLACTRLCLESLLRHRGYPGFEIIVVDNASTDGTPDHLRALARDHPEVSVILNQHNRGFAAANNQGLAVARGARLVLLNNDTIAPPGWLTRLLRHLDDPAVGLAGPVTNSAGNEARIAVPYESHLDVASYALAHYAAHPRPERFDIAVLAMFCAAMRRDVFEAVGPLDERFGVGMFEDDDYAHRVRLAGLRVVCCEDVFVHHFGEASFGKLKTDGRYAALFQENRALFEEKWGVRWKPHSHRT